MSRNTYLDALRGVSLFAVCLFHASVLPGGWLGVDIFFVLSGFWITWFAFEENFRTFFGRRARRLLPALVVLLGVWCLVALFASQTILGEALTAPGGVTSETPPTWLVPLVVFSGSTNWWLAFSDAWPYALGHLWSLAVEWQFYALAPLAVWVLVKAAGRGISRWWCIAGIILLGVSAWVANLFIVVEEGNVLGYLSSIGRAPALLAGMAVAVLLSPKFRAAPIRIPSPIVLPGVLAAAGVIAFLMLRVDQTWVAIGFGLPIVALAAALMVWAFATPSQGEYGGLIVRVLSWTGRRSYGAYLWNLPIVAVLVFWWGGAESYWAGWGVAILSLSVTLLLAQISWRLVERPFLTRGVSG